VPGKKPPPEVLDARRRWFDEYCRTLSENSVVASPRSDGAYPCPCCYCLTLGERGGFEICPVCFWEDDGQGEHDAHVVRGGPNGALSLADARENYRRMGACADRFVGTVRPPKTDEDPS